MIAPPPDGLTDAEIARLETVPLPGPEDMEADGVYRFADTGEFVAEDRETAEAIAHAFPLAKIRVLHQRTATD